METRDWGCLFVACGGSSAVRGRKLAGGNNPVIVCNLIWSEPGQSLGLARPRSGLLLTTKSGKDPWGLFILEIFIVVSNIVPLFNNYPMMVIEEEYLKVSTESVILFFIPVQISSQAEWSENKALVCPASVPVGHLSTSFLKNSSNSSCPIYCFGLIHWILFAALHPKLFLQGRQGWIPLLLCQDIKEHAFIWNRRHEHYHCKWIQLEGSWADQERHWDVAEIRAVGAFIAWQVNERLR